MSGAGAYLTGHVRLRDVAQRAGVFRAKGGGQMIAIFGALPSVWFTVGMMRERLACMQVAVSSSTVRDAFEQLEKMGFLEKMVRPDAPQNAPMRYRRKLTDAQRERLERTGSSTATRVSELVVRRARKTAASAARKSAQDQAAASAVPSIAELAAVD